MNPALAAALDTLGAFLDPARAFAPAADLAPMRAALKAARAAAAKAPPLWYVVTSGDSILGGGFSDCLADVTFYDSPLAYGRACREAAALHDTGRIDTWTAGRAEGPAAALARHEAARAKGAAIAARVRAAAADLKGGR
jgi:hypothetical protein